MISYSTKGIVWHIFNPLENDADIWNLQVFNLQAFKHGFYNSSHILKINLNGIAGAHTFVIPILSFFFSINLSILPPIPYDPDHSPDFLFCFVSSFSHN